MISKATSILLVLAASARVSTGFSTVNIKQHQSNHVIVESFSTTALSAELTSTSRRSFFHNAAARAAVIGSTAATGIAQPAWASGGATAGGAYLLSAKQRYNERVKKGVAGFLALGAALEKGEIAALREYFTSEDVGSWKDLTASGYLLANAFRRNSTAAPDSLPSVKAWKKFAAEVEGMTKALKKKDNAGAMAAYKSAVAALGEYLTLVELPSAAELAA